MFAATANRESGSDNQERWASFEAEAMPHVSSLFRIAFWLTRDRAEAEDLVQETLMAALGSFHRFAPGTNCHAWLVTILYHRNSKRRRVANRLMLVSDNDEQIAETLVFEAATPQNITDEEVLAALQRLPRTFQEVIILADIEEMSYKEIASAIDVPIGTVMSRISRGRKLLRTELAAYARAHGFADRRVQSLS